jgi:hypothetical protein
MLNDMYIEQDVAKYCGLCGRVSGLFELPGMPDRFCLECSADFATVIQLNTEIGAETRAEEVRARWNRNYRRRAAGSWNVPNLPA